MRWGMVINLSRCIRCHACVAACRIEHFLPLRITWPRLIAWEKETDDGTEITTIPVRCNQCGNAPCVEVCPAQASVKRADGIIQVDHDKCVGCRYCVIACPYQNRTYLSKKHDPGYFPGFPRTRFEQKGKKLYPHLTGTTEKCNFCMERIDSGLSKGLRPGIDRDATPACVNVCQARALTFGDLDDPDSEVSRLIRDNSGFQLHPEYDTDPSVYYINPGLANSPSNIAPVSARTGSHMPGLSTRDERARQIFSKDN
ncbi:MAG: 4Fe-4S dicluster domain-containing protein [Dehalococcoidales bacterium]|nr:4Fe-4S dicluster domain-containing protein [Dehalococcoidales bacterium]